MLDLLGAAAMLTKVGHDIERAEHRYLEDSCKILKTSAQQAIGTYRFGWPQLAEATQAHRAAKGFSANEPLKMTGALQASIEYKVGAHEADVGTNNPYAKFQEFGTSKGSWSGKGIPPRPFMGGALGHEKDRIQTQIAHVVAEVFGKKP